MSAVRWPSGAGLRPARFGISKIKSGQAGGLPHLNTIAALLVFAATCAFAQPGEPAPPQPSYSMQDSNLKVALPASLQGVGIDQRLDSQLPLNATFRDEFGRNV